jgi:ABC-2 type transport system ATP-binding protein
MRGKRTVILSTHILSDASQICDRLIILRKGRIAAADTVAELSKRMRSLSEYELFVEGPGDTVETKFRSIPGLIDVRIADGKNSKEYKITARTERDYDPRDDFVRCVYENGFRLLELSPAKTSLEDIFLDLTTEDPR